MDAEKAGRIREKSSIQIQEFKSSDREQLKAPFPHDRYVPESCGHPAHQ